MTKNKFAQFFLRHGVVVVVEDVMVEDAVNSSNELSEVMLV